MARIPCTASFHGYLEIAAAAVLLIAVLIDRAVTHKVATQGAVREVATATGQRATIDLADGSRVILGPRETGWSRFPHYRRRRGRRPVGCRAARLLRARPAPPP